jgi:hypothetical protein
MRRIPFLFGLALFAPLSAVNAQTEDPKTQELIKEGEKAFKAGDCKKATPILKEAYLLSRQSKLLTSIAQCAEFLQDNTEALSAYCAYQTLEPNSQYKDIIEKSVSNLKKKTNSDCPLISDYLPPPKENKPEEPRSNPTPPQKTKRQLPIFVPIGLGVLGAGVGAIAMSTNAKLQEDGVLSVEDRSRVLRLAAVADVAFVAAGVTLFFSLRKPKEAQASDPSVPVVSFSVQVPLP